MTTINRLIVLNTLIRHETLTIVDLGKEENLGMVANKDHLNYLLIELQQSGHITLLEGTNPVTYTITVKGIKEGKRLNEE
jgi:hypothetical protein